MAKANQFWPEKEPLQSVSRALKALNECNHALVSHSDEVDLLTHICRIIVDIGGYRLAWIGLAVDDAKKSVRPVAQAGYEAGYLDSVGITWADDESGRGPTGTAIRTGQTRILKNIQQDPDHALWREQAVRQGYASSIALPLKEGNRIVGALNIYASEVDAFDGAGVKLLSELAGNLAFGMRNLRQKMRLQRMETRLHASEEKYGLLADNSKDGIFLTDTVGLDYINRAFEDITGYNASEVCGKTFDLLELVLPEDRSLILEQRQRAPHNPDPLPLAQFRIRTKNGDIKHIENTTIVLPGPPRRVLGIFRDVSNQKQAEGELQRMMVMMRHTMDAIIRAIGRTVEIRDPYTAGHQRRVADLARAIATELALPQDQIDGLRMASLIHDIGKISVPAEILSKPGRLSELEFNIIKNHPQFGYEILKTIEFPWPVAQVVLQHHERINGSGYPAGLNDGCILMEAKILGLADVVEAMISHRPYRPALSLDDALSEISKNRGVLYDSPVVDACRRLFTEKNFKFSEADTSPQVSA
jgi:PAS domain S-box-containing protein/putative nucleotidyltransferase with HDIG domain